MATKNTAPKTDLYQTITDRIISELEAGRIPWDKPWTGCAGRNGAWSRSTGRAYSLLNQMLLVKPGEYLTFKQCIDAGGHVRKGEKSHIVVFWKQVPITEQDKDGNEIKRFVPMLRYFQVFHIDQCDGIEPKYKPDEIGAFDPDAAGEEIMANYIDREGIKLNIEKSDSAFYAPYSDSITLPLREQFPCNAEFYSTAFHEMTHSTGHKSRLDRISSTAHFGNEEYSKEELVAEIGAASLMNYAGLEIKKTFRNSAAYIQSWLRALRNDKRMIVSAAGKAEKAVNYILFGKDGKAGDDSDARRAEPENETPEAIEPAAPAAPSAPIAPENKKPSALNAPKEKRNVKKAENNNISDAKRRENTPLYFEADTGLALLMPIRKSK